MPSRVRFTCNDVFLFSALSYSIIIVIMRWGDFNTCKKPIQVFLLVDYLLMMASRLIYFAAMHYAESERHSLFIQKIKRTMVTFFVVWTLVGTNWFVQSVECVEHTNQYWTFVIWIALSYLWMCVCGGICVSERRARQRREIEGEMFRFPFRAEPNRAPKPPGLTQEQLHHLPTLLVDYPRAQELMRQNLLCSICLESFVPSETTKGLPNCGHFFHEVCIDEWLVRRNNCPLCRLEVLDGEGNVITQAIITEDSIAIDLEGDVQDATVVHVSSSSSSVADSPV